MTIRSLQNPTAVHTLDLNFLGIPGTIAAYLIPQPRGAVLVECGPGSTKANLEAGLQAHGLSSRDISDVLLTHIHLDHAGAAGYLATQGATIHVHEVGAPHLINPERLLTSAARIYGDMMESLWGEFLPVPVDRLISHKDGDLIEIEKLSFRAIDTPGHAYHHFAYLLGEICFSGDIGGVRMGGTRHLRVPMPPPEFHLEKWRQSVERLKREKISILAPTHFGIYDDPDWHLDALTKALDEVEAWMEEIMPADPPDEQINEAFLSWSRERSLAEGLDPGLLELYEAANPSWMSSAGIQRYYRKHRSPQGQARQGK
jgi:glyoxylase-like metal-dependent hydrolase (beta-lactamase superfamily II)